MTQLFAIDVGGTFTDIVVFDTQTGDVRLEKTPTVPSAPADGVMNAIAKAEVDVPTATTFFHGTTLGINTLLEHAGARVGLITSQGCRDVLEIARMSWPMYRLNWDQPPPLIPRALRREVCERIQADGTARATFTEAEIIESVDDLVARGAEVIAVCFVHAYAFPANEVRAAEIIAARYPDLPVIPSHMVSREYREYERTATTVADAMVRGRMVSYIERLEQGLADRRFDGQLLITRCDGGVMSAHEAKARPIRTLLSGPASGVAGAAAMGRWLELDNIISVDMGGTSFDAAIIVDREPMLDVMTHIEGVPLLMPVIEMATIGAGGGSIAWVDEGGALQVGPRSAGSEPGPACYGRGGTEPTFTDAALISGLLDAAYFLGGEMALDLSAAQAAIDGVAEPLGLSREEAASGIVALTEAKMAATLEEITVGKGYNPRDFALLAYGGGGSLVASALAQRLEIPRVIIPPFAAVYSAWGMLTLDVVHDLSRTFLRKLEAETLAEVALVFDELEAEATQALEREAVPVENRHLLRSIDMRYELQEHTLNVTFSGSPRSLSPEALRASFEQQHQASYGYRMDEPVELVAYRVRAVGALRKAPKPSAGAAAADADPHKGSRRAAHRESGGMLEWAVYDRGSLGVDDAVSGPAFIEEATTTTLVGPTQTATVDELGNLVLTVSEGGSRAEGVARERALTSAGRAGSNEEKMS